MKKLLWLSTACLVIGAVLWNGWLLGWLGHGSAGYLHISISELEAVGQPHAAVFDWLEYISGLFMIVGSLGVIIVRRRSLLVILIALSIGLIGFLTLYDVNHRLDCSQYQNPVCTLKVKADDVSHTDKLHIAESFITAYVTIILALLIVAWTYQQKLPKADLLYATALLSITFITLAILDIGNQTVTNAIAERIWNVAVSLDIIFFARCS